jgi:hypothetical protein
MSGDPRSRCLSCYADDCLRYSGKSQRVSTHRWWFEPAAAWLAEHHPEYLTGAQIRKARRDEAGWHSRKHRLPPRPRVIHTPPSAESIVAMFHVAVAADAAMSLNQSRG